MFHVADTYFVYSVYVYSQFNYKYEGWNFNSGNYLFTTDTK